MPQIVKKRYVSRNGEWVSVAGGGADQSALDPLYLNVSGDTMNGGLALAGDATDPFHAVPRQQLDGYVLKPGPSSIGGNAIATGVPSGAVAVYAGLTKYFGDGLVIGNGGVILNLTGWYAAHWNCVASGTPTYDQRMFASIDLDTAMVGRVSFGHQEDRVACSAMFRATAGQVVKFTMYQTLGVTVNIDARSEFGVHYLGADD